MRNLTPSFTMRRDGILPRGDWFKFVDKAAETPKVYIYDEIGFWGTSASDFVSQLNEITAKKIELHLNSPGGEIFDGLAIYNSIKQHSAEVDVYVDGLAASAASFIAQAGNRVIMARNAQMMIHDGIGFAYGNEQDMLDTAKVLSDLSNNIADLYAFAAKARGKGTTMEDFRALMREEVWYNGTEAVAAGLADEVTDADEDELEEAKNKWDLGSLYMHAGRERAESPLRIQEKIRLANHTKDNKMSQGSDTAPEPTPAPESDAAPETTEPATPAPETDGEPTTPAGSPGPAEAPANKAGQQGVMINGKMETDWKVINQHFQTLQNAQAEQVATHRKGFVEKLAADNKIAASQVDKLVELVNGTDTVPAMSDEQFATFSASYESAPVSSVLGQQEATQPAQPGNQPFNFGGQMTAEMKKDRISVLEGTVAMHRRTMTEEQVKNTNSYKELEKLLADNA